MIGIGEKPCACPHLALRQGALRRTADTAANGRVRRRARRKQTGPFNRISHGFACKQKTDQTHQNTRGSHHNALDTGTTHRDLCPIWRLRWGRTPAMSIPKAAFGPRPMRRSHSTPRGGLTQSTRVSFSKAKADRCKWRCDHCTGSRTRQPSRFALKFLIAHSPFPHRVG